MEITAELRSASDQTIEEAVEFADPMVLRGLLFQLTGDERIAEIPTENVEFGFLDTQNVTDQAHLALLHKTAASLLKALRDQEEGTASFGPMDRLPRSLSLCAGAEIAPCELEMWEEQLAIDPLARGISWDRRPPADRLEEFQVLVVGAGMGGLHAGVMLKQAGISFTIFEKNSGVGGTWHENRYPGARVDTPSRAYTHAYGVNFDYPGTFTNQEENERYFNWVADDYGVRECIEFDTKVESLVWDEENAVWNARATGPDGPRNLRANAVISAVGLLAHPNVPQIEGLEEFSGEAFHTARWPENFDLSGKRVAVIGTGCTGYQLVPELVKDAKQTYIMQRRPNWLFEVEGYLSDYPPEVIWLDRNLPFHTNFSRLRISWLFGPANLRHCFEIDPDFDDEHARSPLNQRIREQRLKFLEGKLGDRPDLLEKMIPEQPPLSARAVFVDDQYSVLDVILRENVSLVDAPIKRITKTGIETSEGEFDVDVIVMATGYRSNDFLWPMEVRGRDGRSIAELWQKDGPRAYLGAMAPGFPNFFMLYGPNTNPYSGGNPINFEEYITRFALECLRGLIEKEMRTVDVTEDAYWRYNDELDRCEKFKIYMDPRARNYFHNEHGRSAVNSSIDERKLWKWLRDPIGSQDGPPLYEGGPIADAAEMHPRFGEDLIAR